MYRLSRCNTTNFLSKCYIAKRIDTKIDDDGNEIPIYAKPEKYMFNIMPAGGELDIASYGERLSYIYKTLVEKKKYINKISEGDIAYLHGAEPKDETKDTYGSQGNYMVDRIALQNVGMMIYFEKLQE